MHGDAISLHDVEELRRYVQETICNQNELEVNYFQITERTLTRRGRPCGIFFCLHGPRSTKFTAIWETDRNTILFYGSAGQRQLKAQVSIEPRLQLQAA
jgi:hypothetical protein